MHVELETPKKLYNFLTDHEINKIGIVDVGYVDPIRLEKRELDYLSLDIETITIQNRTMLGMNYADDLFILNVNDQFGLQSPYLIFPDLLDDQRIIIVAYGIDDLTVPHYKFSLN